MLVTILVSVLLGLSVTFAVQWAYARHHHFKLFERIGIPYVRPNFIHGSFFSLRNSQKTSIAVTSEWVKKYGKVFGFFVAKRPHICITDLDIVKQVLVKDFNVFANRPSINIKVEPVLSTLVGLRDQRWKDVRSILTPTFSMTKMKLMAGVMNSKVDRLLEVFRVDHHKSKSTELYKCYQGLTLEVICECALAMENNCQKNQDDGLLYVVRGFLKNAMNPFVIIAILFPYFGKVLAFLSNTMAYSGKMTSILTTHLKEVIKYRRGNQDAKKTVDVLQLMLDASESDCNEDDGVSNLHKNKLLSDDEIIANAWVFLLGGFETTANTLSFSTFLLAKHKDVQEKLYQEVKAVMKDSGDHVSYEQVAQMTYLDQVLSESLRLYPPVVSFITREAASDIELVGGIPITKDMIITIPVWDIHRDPQHWPRPDTFDPDRFSPESKCSSNRHPMAYLPFGAGPRNCIGMRFGQLEAKIALARVVYNFRLDFCPETEDPPQLCVPTVALNPVDGIPVTVTPR